MRHNQLANLPRPLRCEPDPTLSGTFLLVDDDEIVWARNIPSSAVARVFAAAPELLQGYEGLLEEAYACFRLRFSLEFYDRDFYEFVDDEGELEERFPGAPELARWLEEQQDRYDHLERVVS